MTLTNTSRQYGGVARFFHWTVGGLVIFMLGLGLYMTSLTPGPRMFGLFALHKSIGSVILALAVLRLSWKGLTAQPGREPDHAQWEVVLARIVHGFLYFAIIAMPLSGWIGSSAKNFHVSVFGLFTLPDLTGPDPRLAAWCFRFHSIMAWTVLGALGLHIAGALKHALLDRDQTLNRMLPFATVEPETPRA